MELTQSQKIGIAVGVTAFVILLIVILVVALHNSNSGKDNPEENTTVVTNSYLLFPNDTYRYWDLNGTITNGTDNQALVDELFLTQQFAEFTSERVLIMLSPGTYNLRIQVGYYTSIMGLASTPSGCVIHGSVEVPNSAEVCIGALDNFFRGMSNLTIEVDKPEVPARNVNYFRASQASPIRNVDVIGSLFLAENQKCCNDNPCLGGYSSGGYMADTTVTGTVGYATQQQFFSRNSSFVSASGGAWNLYYMGCTGDVQATVCSTGGKLVTNKLVTPGLIAGAPRFQYNGVSDSFSIIKPGLYADSSGHPGHNSDTVVTDIFIVRSTTKLDEINSQLSNGVSVVFSPGVYSFEEPVVVSKSNTIVLGLAFATIIPTKGKSAIIVNDGVVGVRISGLIFDAGDMKSEALLQIGTTPKSKGDPLNPTILSDIFPRVGGPTETATAHNMVVINQNNTIIDHMWAWRADHTESDRSGLGVDKAVCENGLVVMGDHVKALGVFAEHTLENNVLWDGDDGQLYFQQTELPYDVVKPYAYPGLTVTENVSTFIGDAIGIYSFFATKWNQTVDAPQVPTAIVTPTTPNINISSCFTVFLNEVDGAGAIDTIINNSGSISDAATVSQPQWCQGGRTTCTQCALNCTATGDTSGFPFCDCVQCCDPAALMFSVGLSGNIFKCYTSAAECEVAEGESCVQAGVTCGSFCSGTSGDPFSQMPVTCIPCCAGNVMYAVTGLGLPEDPIRCYPDTPAGKTDCETDNPGGICIVADPQPECVYLNECQR